jgi:hypothetical protein
MKLKIKFSPEAIASALLFVFRRVIAVIFYRKAFLLSRALTALLSMTNSMDIHLEQSATRMGENCDSNFLTS